MKRFIILFVVLIIIAGTGFGFGYVQLRLHEAEVGVLFSRSTGWTRRFIAPEVFPGAGSFSYRGTHKFYVSPSNLAAST